MEVRVVLKEQSDECIAYKDVDSIVVTEDELIIDFKEDSDSFKKYGRHGFVVQYDNISITA